MPGVIPLRLTVTNPDGQASDFSRYGAFTEGSWNVDLPVELAEVIREDREPQQVDQLGSASRHLTGSRR